MTRKDALLVQRSMVHVLPKATQIGADFYDRLFEVAPETRPLFKHSIQEQSKKLMDVISYAIQTLDDPEELIPKVEALGALHKGYGVLDKYYPIVGDVLISRLEKHLGNHLDAETKKAWVAVYTFLADIMQKA